jgi:hypothetical protein
MMLRSENSFAHVLASVPGGDKVNSRGWSEAEPPDFGNKKDATLKGSNNAGEYYARPSTYLSLPFRERTARVALSGGYAHFVRSPPAINFVPSGDGNH